MSNDKTARIRELNDRFRTNFSGGQVMMTDGVGGLDEATKALVLNGVRSYIEFTPDNDPHGKHDIGSLEVHGEKVFWKIDYYDNAMEAGSEDPSDPARTTRVLTIMLADEY